MYVPEINGTVTKKKMLTLMKICEASDVNIRCSFELENADALIYSFITYS